MQNLGLKTLNRLGALVSIGVVGLALTGCDMILGPSDGPELVKPATDLLVAGDVPGATAKYDEIAAANPDSVHAAIGKAYGQLLAGDYAGADATLAAVEDKNPEMTSEIKLRRALVALRDGDLDAAKEHGAASGLPEGKLFAAEVHLVDLESDQATTLLKEIEASGGAVGQTATQYVKMLDSGDQYQQALAEATALWALGERGAACEAAEEVLSELEDEKKDDLLLLWAGRAVTSGNPGAARTMLDMIEFPPQGQAWRKGAIEAMILVAEGQADEAVTMLEGLEGAGAPADGIADARATAAALADDKEACKALIGNTESEAAARSLMHCGAVPLAKGRAPEGTALKDFLRSL